MGKQRTNLYKDYKKESMEKLREDLNDLLENNDMWQADLYDRQVSDEEGGMKIDEGELNHKDYGWSRQTLKRALTTLRQYLEEKGKIKVEVKYPDALGSPKKWVKKEDLTED